MKEEKRFHSYYDAKNGAPYRDKRRGIGNEAISGNEKLSYQFYSHFHPYVRELVKRLIQQSISGLQSADTEYSSQSNDGTLEVLPDSTLVALINEVEVILPDRSTKRVPKGTQIFLPQYTMVTLLDDQHRPIMSTPVPGTMSTTRPLAMVFYRNGSTIQVVANQGTMKLNRPQQIRLPPQGRVATFPESTELIFVDCKPKPKLYEGLFSFEAEGLVAYWKFDEKAGTVANDASGNGNNAQIRGPLLSEEGKYGSALRFDGNTFAEVNYLNQIDPGSDDFSIAFWIKIRDGPGGFPRRSIIESSPLAEALLEIQPNTNKISYSIAHIRGESEGIIELELWTHICFMREADTIKLYIDNRLDKMVGGFPPGGPWLPPISMGRGLNGSLDDVRIYNRALSEQEVGRVMAGEAVALFPYRQYFPSNLVESPYPVKDLDFSSRGAYSVYNWELFYHVPITFAIHLSKNQRFEEAHKWFHYIFDPTSGDNNDRPVPERFWKVKPFQSSQIKLIQEILLNLSTGADPNLWQETISSSEALKNAPFHPHVVARYRQSAYMLKAIMAYLDNLLDWGDTLFRQDTGESINEATQVYVLAANILGPRPQAVPKKSLVQPKTYASLRKDLDNFDKILEDLENKFPFDLAPPPLLSPPSNNTNDNNTANDVNDRYSIIRSLGATLYFCIPRNDKLLSYWDTVTERLFKIHNSLNIQGVFRQLPLFEPAIDPALLAKAAAAGVDIGATLSGINQPLSLVRFQFLVQKAAEICQEVRLLGNNLLSALEKEDNEALAILRAKHERSILELAETVKYGQLQEAIKAREGLLKSLDIAIHRYAYYERLLGKQEAEIKIPELDAMDKEALQKTRLKTSEPEVGPRKIEVNLAQGVEDVSGGKKVSSYEAQELNFMKQSQDLQDEAAQLDLLSSFLSMIPEFSTDVKPMGVGTGISVGGRMFSKFFAMVASESRSKALKNSYEANKAARIGSYDRREQEWAFQSNLAAAEITQIFKQLRAAQIREAIAEKEWENHQQQIRFAEEIERFLTDENTGKKTNQAFYTWMKREVKGLYGQCFQFAFDIAKKAERALQLELGNQELSFIQFNYLAGKEGLLAGEKLYLDIKRMEMKYHELNQREYELTKHVSLLQVNPEGLLKLRTTGSCTVFLPEELFDMDCPGHYFRRIKSVAVSIPSVTGPYTSINCRLTLRNSQIRKNTLLRSGGDNVYDRDGPDDDRFSDDRPMQSIVTSSAQSDSGLFEINLRDERYLPFENSGAISEWQLQLPANPSNGDPAQFDYATISDVILHIRYTAREGGDSIRHAAVGNLTAKINGAQGPGPSQLFSARHEFPTEWAKFKSIKIEGNTRTSLLSLEFRQEHFPFWSQGRIKAIKRVVLFAKGGRGPIEITERADGTGQKDTLARNTAFGNLWRCQLTRLPQIQPNAPLSIKFDLYFTKNSMDDLWLELTWGGSSP